MLMHTYQSHKLTDLRRSLILFHCIYFVFPFIGKTRWYWTTGKLSTKLFLFSSLLTLPPLSLSLDLQGPSGATGSKVSYTTHSSLSSHVLSLSLCLRDHPVSAQAVLYSQTQQRLISTSVPQGRTQHYPNTEPSSTQLHHATISLLWTTRWRQVREHTFTHSPHSLDFHIYFCVLSVQIWQVLS